MREVPLEHSPPAPKIWDGYISNEQVVFQSQSELYLTCRGNFRDGRLTFWNLAVVYTILRIASKLIRRMSDSFNHIVNSCCLCFDNTIVLTVMIPHKVKHSNPDETDDGEVRIPVR